MIFKPPQQSIEFGYHPSVFLAGSIEQGATIEWQEEASKQLDSNNVIIYNPRRDNWDSSWKQEITNPQFKEQVNWELDYITSADLILFYFVPNTKSPITLLELGLVAPMMDTEPIVCCPEGFWRKGNVDIVCMRYGIRQVETLDKLIQAGKDSLVRTSKIMKI